MRHHARVHFSKTCPGNSRRTICTTLAYLEWFSVAPRLRLLQRFEIMRLPSDTFARRRLTVTPFMRFKFHNKSPTSTMYWFFWYLLGLSRSRTHVASITWKLISTSTVMIYPTSMWRRVISRRSDMSSGDFASSCRGRLEKSRGGWGVTIEVTQIDAPWQSRRRKNTSCLTPTSKKM